MMKIKNVIIVNDYAYVNGGSAKVAIETALSLKKVGMNVIFFTAVAPIDERLVESGIRVECLNEQDVLNKKNKLVAMVSNIWNRIAEKKMRSLLEEYDSKDTIVHVHGWTKALSASFFKPTKNKRFYTVITTHDYFSTCPNGGYYNYKHHTLCKHTPLSLKCLCCNCDKRSYVHKLFRVVRQWVQNRYVKNDKNIYFISISELNEKLNICYTKSKKYTRIYNPIKVPKCIKDNSEYAGCFVYVGRISDEKGTDIFCEVAQKIKEKYDNIEFCVIGTGENLVNYKQKYAQVNFLGWMSHDDAMGVVSQARALILPSRCYEGAPLTVVEAMMQGVPCIVSDSTSAVENVRNNMGYIFAAENKEELEKCILKSLNSENYGKIKENIVNNWDKELYSENEYINRLIKLYNNILTSNGI